MLCNNITFISFTSLYIEKRPLFRTILYNLLYECYLQFFQKELVILQRYISQLHKGVKP